MEILETGDECGYLIFFHESAQSGGDSDLIFHFGNIVGAKLVFFAYRFKFRIDGFIGNFPHHIAEVADSPGVDLPAEFYLRFDFVALGYRDIAHVVAESGAAEFPAFHYA